MAVLIGAGMGLASLRGGEPSAPRPELAFQLHGEFGLAVADSGDSVIVRWMTQREDSGEFRAYDGAAELYRALTPKSRAHRAAFRRPRSRLITLVYGSAGTSRDTTLISLRVPSRPRTKIKGADSVFVVGDVHGKYSSLMELLSLAGVIDARGRWSGGHARLVFVGDLVDRGDDATRVLWLVYRLEREAVAAGGAVDVVLGNHEIMEWVGDRRYLAPKESLLAASYGTCYACLYDLRSSVLGRWLASKPGIIQINDVIYVHGGITPRYARMGVSGFNDALYRYLREPIFTHLLEDSTQIERFGTDLYQRRFSFFFQPDSPFWFRGYVQSDTFRFQLDTVLAQYGVRTQVVGHTPVSEIVPMYGGKLVPVNVADFATQLVLFTYGKNGARRSKRIGLRLEPDSW